MQPSNAYTFGHATRAFRMSPYFLLSFKAMTVKMYYQTDIGLIGVITVCVTNSS